eukprot:scaffold2666_cov78-Skeletonema_dohrnii-CCMP3373.AAC.2
MSPGAFWMKKIARAEGSMKLHRSATREMRKIRRCATLTAMHGSLLTSLGSLPVASYQQVVFLWSTYISARLLTPHLSAGVG